MNDFWNQRYSSIEYAYGEAPNEFVKVQLSKLQPGTILFPAEGEGRNAVYAALQNWKVSAFDSSSEGRKKAFQLAKKYNVNIDYRITTYEEVNFQTESFDCVVLVFAHMPPAKRSEYHQKLWSFLKPGGTLLLEGFHKNQIFRNSGGPKNIDMLFSEAELSNDFSAASELSVSETETELNEGKFHRGTASIIRVIARK
ncbi:class I SAM-dependent methyltransferase [Maribellus mangrovi]|uniref:class I SAM-dependent methyltransferase n=1 Tax=Maribellus mangrovi TaxID=3133146 RepID=UPI0030ED047B